MVQININGQPPGGGGGGGNGPKPGPAGAPRPTQASDYAKALAQQARQMADAMRKQREENSAYAQYDSEKRRQKQQEDRIAKEEIRQREKELRERQRRDRDTERRRQADELAEIRLRRQQDMEAMRRGQQEWALRRTFSHMSHRAGGHLSTSGFRNLGHQADIFNERVWAFRNRWGQMPDYGGNLGALRRGMGTQEGTYHVSNILRMGAVGQRSAFEGNYTELVRIERELKRIEAVTEKKYRFDISPAAQANLQRQKNALLDARARIEAGTEGHGAVYNAMGRGYGFLMNTFRSPVARTIEEGIMTGVASSYVTNRMLSGVIGLQRPWINFDLAAHSLARGAGAFGQRPQLAGIRANAIERTLLNMGASGLVAGNGLSSYSARFGLNPKDSINQVLSQYGVPVRSEGSAARIAASVRMGYLSSGVQLPENRLFEMLGGATSAGLVAPNQAGRDSYFRELQKTMAVATRQGVDQSRMASGWTTLMRTASAGSLSTNLGGLSRFFRSMAASGAMGAREGQLQASAFAGTQQAIQGIGVTGDVGMDIAMMSAFHGRLPTSQAALEKAFGIKFDTTNPSVKKALSNYLEAARQGSPFALELLQPLLSGQTPDVMRKFLMKGVIGQMPAGMRQVAMARRLNTSITAYTAMTSGGAGGAAMSGVAPYLTPGMFSTVSNAASGNVTAPMLAALLMHESGGNPTAVSSKGAVGLSQMMPGTIAQYNQEHGTNYSVVDVRNNPALAAKMGSWYFGKMLSITGDNNPVLAYGLYNWGPGKNNSHLQAILNGQEPPETRRGMAQYAQLLSQYTNSGEAITQLHKLGISGSAELEGSRSIAIESDAVVAAFKGVVGAVDGLAAAAVRAASKLNAIGANQRMPGGYISPDGSYVPSSGVLK